MTMQIVQTAKSSILSAMPAPLRNELFVRYKEHQFLRYIREKFAGRVKPVPSGKVAPPALIETEALMHAEDMSEKQQRSQYIGSGFAMAHTILTALEEQGADLTRLQRVLDFGCGSARVIRHFRNIEGLELFGADANPEPITWDRANLPGIDFRQNELEPPLSYDSDQFDLIYALSVFTHIPFKWQKPWIDELYRVMRPGGYLFCTVTGGNYMNQLTDEEREIVRNGGRIELDADSSNASYSTKVLKSWDVFQSLEEIRQLFSERFELLHFTDFSHLDTAGQERLILRKPTHTN